MSEFDRASIFCILWRVSRCYTMGCVDSTASMWMATLLASLAPPSVRRPRRNGSLGRPGIVSSPPKLIPKGNYGVSIWVLVLLDKYSSYRPTERFLGQLDQYNLDLPGGTINDGLQRI